MQFDADIRYDGPWFDSRGPRVVAKIRKEINLEVAKVAKDMVFKHHIPKFKKPTGAYARRVVLKQRGPDIKVWDQDSVYGPWLEGTGSRNFPVTRFKGYHGWRKARQATEKKVLPTARKVLRRYMRELN